MRTWTGAEPGALSLRALCAAPLATAALAAVELAVQARWLDLHLPSVLWALLAAGASGLPLSALALLLVSLARRRGLPLGWPALIPGPAIAAVALMTLGAALAIVVPLHALGGDRIDFAENALRFWRIGLLLGLPLPTLLGYVLLRWLEPRLRGLPWLPGLAVGAVAAALAALLGVGQLFSYFGLASGLLLVGLMWGAAASLLPGAQLSRTAHKGAAGAAALTLLGLGWAGLQHPGARALLLHETRVLRLWHNVVTAGFDLDHDGDLPGWAGGGDCDNLEPAISSLHVELAGNGHDDNCYAGDAVGELAPAARVSPGERRSVVLITVDALRAVQLASQGYARDTMPLLEQRARRGRWYRRAYAPANHTRFSVMSLLSGQSVEALRSGSSASPRARYQTRFWLPPHLAAQGYHTVVFNPPAAGDGDDLFRYDALGFEHVDPAAYDFRGHHRGTSSWQVTNAAIRYLAARDPAQPVFAWVHYEDPHAVHEAHAHFVGTDLVSGYDNELYWVDRNLGRLFEFLDDHYQGRALLVLTSDHGEQLGERGVYGHGLGMWETELRVPLLIEGPGVAAAAIDAPVSLLGLVPTLLDLLGLAPIDGLSYPSLLSERFPSPVIQSAEQLLDPQREESALVRGDLKLVTSRTTRTSRVFDLARDPAEQVDLAARRPELLRELRRELFDALERRR